MYRLVRLAVHKDVQLIIELDQRYDLGLCHGLAPILNYMRGN